MNKPYDIENTSKFISLLIEENNQLKRIIDEQSKLIKDMINKKVKEAKKWQRN